MYIYRQLTIIWIIWPVTKLTRNSFGGNKPTMKVWRISVENFNHFLWIAWYDNFTKKNTSYFFHMQIRWFLAFHSHWSETNGRKNRNAHIFFFLQEKDFNALFVGLSWEMHSIGNAHEYKVYEIGLICYSFIYSIDDTRWYLSCILIFASTWQYFAMFHKLIVRMEYKYFRKTTITFEYSHGKRWPDTCS